MAIGLSAEQIKEELKDSELSEKAIQSIVSVITQNNKLVEQQVSNMIKNDSSKAVSSDFVSALKKKGMKF
jgi:ABC-type transport system involved in cytochrome bd biosynthesis fused ATPase/permease subunit